MEFAFVASFSRESMLESMYAPAHSLFACIRDIEHYTLSRGRSLTSPLAHTQANTPRDIFKHPITMCEIERHQYTGCTCAKIYEEWTKKPSFCESDEPGTRCVRDDRKLYCGGIKLFEGWCPDCLQAFSNTLSLGFWDNDLNLDNWFPVDLEMTPDQLETDVLAFGAVSVPEDGFQYPPRQPPQILPQNLGGHTPIRIPAKISPTPAAPRKKTPLEERPVIPRPIPKYQYPSERKPYVKRAPRGSTAPKFASPKPATARSPQKRRRTSQVKDEEDEEYTPPQKRVAMGSNPTAYVPPVFRNGIITYSKRPAYAFEGSLLSMPAIIEDGKRTDGST